MSGKTAYHTRQQEELLRYLRSTRGQHHTVAQLRDHFSRDENPIGTTTIYRQLEKLVAEGSVRKYLLETGDSACYEYAQQSQACTSHFHCKCKQCGRLIHMDCDELQQLREHLLREHGFEWDAGRTVFYGICDQCRSA